MRLPMCLWGNIKALKSAISARLTKEAAPQHGNGSEGVSCLALTPKARLLARLTRLTQPQKLAH